MLRGIKSFFLKRSSRLKTCPVFVAGALLCCICLAPAVSSQAATPADSAVLTLAADSIVLRVSLNTEDKGDFFVGVTKDFDYLVKTQDLKTIGFKEPAGTTVMLDGESYISLRSMPGVTFLFDNRTLALLISADSKLLPGQALKLRSDDRIKGVISRDNSAFFNYAISSSHNSPAGGQQLGLAGEFGWRLGDYLLLTNGNTTQEAGRQSTFVRLMTSVTHDDRESLRRTVIGDFFTPAREFNNGVNLGGISVSKLYGLNPYLTRFPTQSINGSVATPSDIEVYLDGQRIRSERIKPGEFELRDLLAYGGARNVQVLLRDAFGRVQELNYSFYFSDQPLQQGLHEYSYNLGAMRREFGLKSNEYGPAAFSAFHRYGVSDALTLGLRAEGTQSFYNVGPTATAVLGSAGVLNAALSTSSLGGDRGAAGTVSYNYQSRLWSAGMSLRRDWGHYASLGEPPIITRRNHEVSLAASYYLQRYGSVSLGYSVQTTRTQMLATTASAAQQFNIAPVGSRRVTSLNYNVPLVSGRASLQASLSHINDGESRNEAFVGLIYFLDRDYSLAASVRGDKNNHTELLQLTKTQPVGEGLGYVLSADRATSPTIEGSRLNSRIQYNASAAVLQGEFGRRRDIGQTTSDYRVSMAGGVAWVDGQLALGRPVTESFGIVKVGEIPGVAVAVNGQPIGRTDASGKIFVPTLSPYFDNDISIAPESVPIEYSIPSTVKRVSPSLRSGTIVDFGVTRIQAFTGHLKSRQEGISKAVELQEISVNLQGKTLTLQTGRGGEFYLENLKAGSYAATAAAGGKPCLFELVIPRSEETFVDLGEFVCEAAPR